MTEDELMTVAVRFCGSEGGSRPTREYNYYEEGSETATVCRSIGLPIHVHTFTLFCV